MVAVERQLTKLCDKLKDASDGNGPNPNLWQESVQKEMIPVLIEIASLLEAENERFSSRYNKNLDPGGLDAARLARIRRHFLTHHVEFVQFLATMAVQDNVDITLSTVACYVWRSLYTSSLDANKTLSEDPHKLGYVRVGFEELGQGLDVKRIIDLATNENSNLTEEQQMQRAVSTSVLNIAVRECDMSELKERAGWIKSLLNRLNLLWFGSTKSPRRTPGRSKRAPSPTASTGSKPASEGRIAFSVKRPSTNTPAKRNREPESTAEGQIKRKKTPKKATPPRPTYTKTIEGGLLFPKGVHEHSPSEKSIKELDSIAILQTICTFGYLQEIVAPVMQSGLIDVLLCILDDNNDPSEELLIVSQILISALLTHKKIALLFVESGGVEQILSCSEQSFKNDHAVILQLQCDIVQGVCKASSVLERLASTHVAVTPLLVRFCNQLLNSSLIELQREAGNVLADTLKLPCVLTAFDDQKVLSTLISSVDRQNTNCASGLESALCSALLSYLASHLLLNTAQLWPHSKRLGKGMCKSTYKALPTRDIVAVISHLEQPLSDLLAAETGPDKRSETSASQIMPPGIATGLMLLTKGRIPAVSAIEDLGAIPVILRLLRAACRWSGLDTLEPALSLLELLCAIPHIRWNIASCQVEEVGVTCGLGLLLEVASQVHEPQSESHSNQNLPKLLNLKALNCVRLIMCPPPTGSSTEDLRRYDDLWQLFRSNNGLRVILLMLSETGPYSDQVRLHVSRILLAMCGHPTLKIMLVNLGIPRRLLNLVHETEQSRQDCENTEREAFINLFGKCAAFVIRILTGADVCSSTQSFISDMDHALCRLEKRVVVDNADIEFDEKELAQIIASYLRSVGLKKSAAMLKLESKLDKKAPSRRGKPLPPLHTLPDIVKSFLKQQHLGCKTPISTLPTFSLRKGQQPALRATDAQEPKCSNVAARFRQALFENTRTRHRAAFDRKLMYSQFKPVVLTRGDHTYIITSVGFSQDGERALVGAGNGVVAEFPTSQPFELQKEYDISSESIIGIRSTPLHNKYCIWFEDKISLHDCDDLARVTFELPGYRSALFGNVNKSILVATSSGRCSAALVDLETKRLTMQWEDKDRRTDNECNLACSSASDQIILSDAVLYDVRKSADSPIHRYDKLIQHSRGIFSLSQNEVIIDKEVWDTRTHKLLQTIPSLSNTLMQLSPSGSVIYGVQHGMYSHEDDVSRSARIMVVVDGITFDPIHTMDQYDTIEDFAIDPTGNLLGLALNVEQGSSVRLLEIGRSKVDVEEGSDGETDIDIDGDDEEDEEDEEHDLDDLNLDSDISGESSPNDDDDSNSVMIDGVWS
eukprot:TRINITY_DN1967_c0_g1_i1.p1 TRINITY_DN1967_c0_g1~~TRINITY_DN1967_c0_g1_i1.p1  ORF type:complete len:1393 (+),score=239.78 TRINITY_DN1967_c0_g1_i1:184-4179(+)